MAAVSGIGYRELVELELPELERMRRALHERWTVECELLALLVETTHGFFRAWLAAHLPKGKQSTIPPALRLPRPGRPAVPAGDRIEGADAIVAFMLGTGARG